PREEQSARVMFIVERRVRIETADPHPLRGLDELFAIEVNCYVRDPLGLPPPSPPAEKQQIAFLELTQLLVRSRFNALPRLLVGVAIQFDPVHKENQLDEAGAVQSFGRTASPKVGSAQKQPRSVLDIFWNRSPCCFPRRVIGSRLLRQEA